MEDPKKAFDDPRLILADLGISEWQSHWWQTMSRLPDEILFEMVAEARAARDVITSAAVYNKARHYIQTREHKDLPEPELPDGRFRVIVIDPPWPMKKIERKVAPAQFGFDYPTMNEEELTVFPVQGMAADDCHMWLWTTHKFLPMALRLLEAWDFGYVCTFVWHKPGGFQPYGLPQYNCEFALYARYGNPTFTDVSDFNCCFQAKRHEHSRKPDEFYDLVARVTEGPRIDVFSREARNGFAQFGNEASRFTTTK